MSSCRVPIGVEQQLCVGACRVERSLRERDQVTEAVDRPDELADDRADEREPEARVQARDDPRERRGNHHLRRHLPPVRAEDSRDV